MKRNNKMKSIKTLLTRLLPLFGLTAAVFLFSCAGEKPALIEVVIPYVNDSKANQTINLTALWKTESPSPELIAYVGGNSSGGVKLGSTGYAGRNVSYGRYTADYNGKSLGNIVISGNSSGRSSGIVTLFFPAEQGDLTDYRFSTNCHFLSFDTSPNDLICPFTAQNSSFGNNDYVTARSGTNIAMKRTRLPWVYVSDTGAISTYLPTTVNVSTLPPPTRECREVCRSYKRSQCWYFGKCLCSSGNCFTTRCEYVCVNQFYY